MSAERTEMPMCGRIDCYRLARRTDEPADHDAQIIWCSIPRIGAAGHLQHMSATTICRAQAYGGVPVSWTIRLWQPTNAPYSWSRRGCGPWPSFGFPPTKTRPDCCPCRPGAPSS